jgi:hypothetical protein
MSPVQGVSANAEVRVGPQRHGWLAGVPWALLFGRHIEVLVFTTRTTDPVTFLAVAAMLLVIGIAATLMLALRAGRPAPLQAIRSA